MERISRFRAVLLLVFFAFVLVLFAGKLFSLQIIETKGNTNNQQTYTTITTVRAARGDILDRNGNVLVGNRASYDLVFNHYVINSYPDRNDALYRLIQKCKELNITLSDHFPVTRTRPFEYTLTELNTSWQNHFQTFMVDRSWDSDITAPLLMQRLRSSYKIPEQWSDEDARAVVGLLYEFTLRGITNLPTYTFLEDVSNENLSALLELNTPGLVVESSTVREYHTKYAAHILGYVGSMSESQWQKFKDQDYSMDAMVGQAGFEEAFEEYLHGIDGTRADVVNKNGATVESFYIKDKETGKLKEPVAGNNVETTIDIRLQQACEEALDETMKNIRDPAINTEVGDKVGHDAEGAAVIVIECKTGNILACASYPTYDLSTMLEPETWAAINSDPLKPLFNRAFGAAYAPGSTHKPCTLIAAMENRNSKGQWIYTPGEIIRDTGYYDNPDVAGFHPTCLFYTSSGGSTHGDCDATWAMCVSCNVFFYELGYRMTIEMMEETQKALGLGEPTGIELVENIGYRNSPERKREVYGSGIDGNFSAGDRILGAIGQAENRFTPLQLAVYASTLANKGTRMKATFLSRVVSSDYRTLVYQSQPQIVSQLEMQSTTIETYMQGMHDVVYKLGGTATNVFGGPKDLYGEGDGPWYLKDQIDVYAKTGTAEHSSGGSSHGALICFTKRKDSQDFDIALGIFGEKVAHGSSLNPIAEKVVTAYYEMQNASETTAFENQVG